MCSLSPLQHSKCCHQAESSGLETSVSSAHGTLPAFKCHLLVYSFWSLTFLLIIGNQLTPYATASDPVDTITASSSVSVSFLSPASNSHRILTCRYRLVTTEWPPCPSTGEVARDCGSVLTGTTPFTKGFPSGIATDGICGPRRLSKKCTRRQWRSTRRGARLE